MILELLAQSPAAFIAVVFVLGLLVGSFLNVVVYRLPLMLEREWRQDCAELQAATAAAPGQPSAAAAATPPPARYNLLTPRSACPSCQAPVTALQNIPVLSWLWLRGRCASCRAPISGRYPLVELITALLSALVAWRFGYGTAALCALVVTWLLIPLTLIDIDHQLLPDNLNYLLLWSGLLASVLLPGGSVPPVDLRSAVIGAVAGYLALWSVYWLFKLATGKEGMGYGDFKLLAALGAWLGWQMLLPIVLLSSAVGAMVGIGMIAARAHRWAKPLPFGPYLAIAGFIAMLWGRQWTDAYLQLFAH